MDIITVKQPWANLIIDGIKPVENRTWKCPEKYIGKRIGIHSSAKPILFDFLEDILTNDQINALNGNIEPFRGMYLGHIIGSVEVVDCVQNHPSVWAGQGMWHWVLANPIKFKRPIPAKGKLSFWKYTVEDISSMP